MAYEDSRFDLVQLLREALVPPPRRVGRTCDCPIVFPEDPDFVGQVHRWDCPNRPRQRNCFVDEKGSLKKEGE